MIAEDAYGTGNSNILQSLEGSNDNLKIRRDSKCANEVSLRSEWGTTSAFTKYESFSVFSNELNSSEIYNIENNSDTLLKSNVPVPNDDTSISGIPFSSTSIPSTLKTTNLSTRSNLETIIHLDIGGIKFSTSRSTLLADPNSMLAAMFGERHKINPAFMNSDGTYFIDRDGTYFRYILNYLRDGEVDFPDDIHICKQILREAQYYSVQNLESLLEEFIMRKTNTQEEFTTVELTRSYSNHDYTVYDSLDKFPVRDIRDRHAKDTALIQKIANEYGQKGYRLYQIIRNEKGMDDWRTTMIFQRKH